ncbi:MAG: ribbon-helix-helix protein, CopG family [Armatimonadota bacterium]
MKKVAISLPDAQAEAIERIRRRQRIPRSRVIQRAIAVYLAEQGRHRVIRAYEDGYRKKPERMEDVQFLAKATAAALEPEDWE